jgi:hypothetical protein
MLSEFAGLERRIDFGREEFERAPEAQSLNKSDPLRQNEPWLALLLGRQNGLRDLHGRVYGRCTRCFRRTTFLQLGCRSDLDLSRSSQPHHTPIIAYWALPLSKECPSCRTCFVHGHSHCDKFNSVSKPAPWALAFWVLVACTAQIGPVDLRLGACLQ